MSDRIHKPARTTLLPWLPALLAEARAAGAAGAALSGAGTTVCALCAPETAPAVVRALSHAAASRGVPGRSEVVGGRARGTRGVDVSMGSAAATFLATLTSEERRLAV